MKTERVKKIEKSLHENKTCKENINFLYMKWQPSNLPYNINLDTISILKKLVINLILDEYYSL